MRHRIRRLFLIVASLALVTGVAAEPEWQRHARWCTTDRGSSYRAYMNACTQVDQFHSVISCQQDAGNARAVSLIQQAGPEAVNAFMQNIKPAQCK